MTAARPVRERGDERRRDSARHTRSRAAGVVLPPLVFGAVVLGIWQLVAGGSEQSAGALPAPSRILDRLVDSGDLVLEESLASGTNAAIGLLLGVVVGLLVAVAASWTRAVDALVSPLAAAAAAVPIVALAPAMYKMFSANSEVPRQLVIAIVVFFPMYVNTIRGLRQVTAVQRDLMNSYAAGRWDVTRTVRFPAAWPHIFTALRIAAPVAVITEIVAEYFGGLKTGLGQRITAAASQSNFALAWAYVVASIALGLVFFLAALLLERLAVRGRRVS